jgi:HK97 gp10 family phage protein
MPVTLEGMDDLLEKLQAIDGDVRRAKIGALRIGAGIVKRAIERHAHNFPEGYSKGNIADNIVAVPSKTADGEMSMDIGPEKKRAYYARFVEFGTKFQRSRPFVEPAFQESKSEALEAMRARIREQIRNPHGRSG